MGVLLFLSFARCWPDLALWGLHLWRSGPCAFSQFLLLAAFDFGEGVVDFALEDVRLH